MRENEIFIGKVWSEGIYGKGRRIDKKEKENGSEGYRKDIKRKKY